MRPKDVESGKELYECLECGERVEAPETKVCDSCGSRMKHIGRPRDL
ncbi:hypothetical protein BRC65_07560 [Halobacteriales archaeon QH_2_65_14]|nr:MAG: hypothetical protein BRC65_07560 [Halobacteriales archaeon QH_2_65_14]